MANSNTNDKVLATATAEVPTIDAAATTFAKEPTMSDLKELISRASPPLIPLTSKSYLKEGSGMDARRYSCQTLTLILPPLILSKCYSKQQ